MSRANKHRLNQINGLALIYIRDVLGLGRKCPRRSCSGHMVEVWTRYKNQGPTNKEQECCLCGKVIKDPRFKEERERRWRAKKRRWQERKDRGPRHATHK